MAYTATPTTCPKCHALTFDGRINVRVWTGANGAQRYYPNGDHAKACAANVKRAAENAAYEAKREAWRVAGAKHLEMLHRWGARVKPLIEAHREEPEYLARVSATVERLVAHTPRLEA